MNYERLNSRKDQMERKQGHVELMYYGCMCVLRSITTNSIEIASKQVSDSCGPQTARAQFIGESGSREKGQRGKSWTRTRCDRMDLLRKV